MSRVSVWQCQIQNWGIVAIVEPFLTRITCVIASELSQFCLDPNDISDSEIKPKSALSDWSGTLIFCKIC